MSEDKGQRTGLAIRYIEDGDGDPRHGTANGYCNLRCRCAACTKAWAVTYLSHRAKPRQLEPTDRRHGTDNAYHYWHCKCPACLAAHTAACTKPKKVAA